jgi:hypothetical protein
MEVLLYLKRLARSQVPSTIVDSVAVAAASVDERRVPVMRDVAPAAAPRDHRRESTNDLPGLPDNIREKTGGTGLKAAAVKAGIYHPATGYRFVDWLGREMSWGAAIRWRCGRCSEQVAA